LQDHFAKAHFLGDSTGDPATQATDVLASRKSLSMFGKYETNQRRRDADAVRVK